MLLPTVLKDKTYAILHTLHLSTYVIEVGCRGAAPEAQSAVRGHVTARFGDFLGTKRAGRTSVAMPPHNRISEDEVDYVA